MVRDCGSMAPITRPPLAAALSRALRLRCPMCGRSKLFRSWFRMNEACAECGINFDRGPGFYLGSIYINYGLTAFVVTVGYLAMFFADVPSAGARLAILAVFCLLFPLWFFRYARSLWLAMDVYFDPK
jgi:uncharacterized protein (DUF983 family)